MYLFGIIQHAWTFSIWNVLVTFIMDIALVRILSLGIGIKIINESSIEERQYFKDKSDYFRKKWEVEELNRKILDKQLYG